ncbi:MAG: carboxypeptidase-like regulatory domain-containing protein [Gemmatimonadaceae bacterium]
MTRRALMERPRERDALTVAMPAGVAETRDGGAMRRALFWGLGVGLVAAVATPASCQSSIVGSVYDSLGTRGPLRQATLVLVERSQYATTDDRGQFTFDDVPAGRYSVGLLHAVLDSFDLVVPVRVIDVPSGAPLRIALATPSAATAYRLGCGERLPRVESRTDVVGYLKVRAVCAALARRAAEQESRSLPADSTTGEGPRFQPMQPVIVRDSLRVRSAMERSGFEERRRHGLGAFVTEDILSRHHYETLANVLGTIRGVHVEYGTSGRPVVYLVGTKDTYCVPSFFVDGALYHLPLPTLRRSSLRPGDSESVAFGDLSAILPTADIKGIEVYSSPGGIPPQFDYTSTTGCGSVVVWTR